MSLGQMTLRAPSQVVDNVTCKDCQPQLAKISSGCGAFNLNEPTEYNFCIRWSLLKILCTL